jgi:hypothetical protein
MASASNPCGWSTLLPRLLIAEEESRALVGVGVVVVDFGT